MITNQVGDKSYFFLGGSWNNAVNPFIIDKASAVAETSTKIFRSCFELFSRVP